MRFTPQSEEQLAESKLIPEGEYPFVISEAKDTTSKSSGNDMLALLVRVYKPDGGFVLINDYLTDKVMYKLNNLSKCVGVEEAYKNGNMSGEDLFGKEGFCKVKIQKDKEGIYGDKNVIADYIVPKDKKEKKTDDAKTAKKQEPKETILDDEIPF